MPYSVMREGDSWCVKKDADGSDMGCFASEAEANEQVQALYASEDKAVTETFEFHSPRLFVDKEYPKLFIGRMTMTDNSGKTHVTEDGGATWTVIQDKASDPPPDDEEADEPEGDPEADAEPETVSEEATVSVPSGVRKLIIDLEKGLAKAFRRKDADEQAAFKVVGNAWFIVWSNNFKDRDGEIFTQKAIDEYITRLDTGIVPMPELWVWHTPGTRIGQADYVDRHGHFVVAGGTFDDTPDGRKAQAYYAKHAHEKGISHGYHYPVEAFDGKHYNAFNSFEFTPLPLGAEANLFTSFEGVKDAQMHEKKQAELEAVFGKERAAEILASLDARGKALEALEVEYKDFTGEDLTAQAHKEAVDTAGKDFAELLVDVLESSAEPITAALEAVQVAKAVKAEAAEQHKALEAQYAEAIKQIDALRKEMELSPRRASKDIRTKLQDGDPLLEKSQLGQNEALKEMLPTLYKDS